MGTFVIIMKNKMFFIVVFISSIIFSQDNISDNFILIEGDSIMKNSIGLNEIVLLPKIKFNDRDDLRNYLILKRKTLKVYPYAILASDRLDSLYSRLLKLKRKSSKKRYVKQIQKYLEGKFTAELKKLTRTEGQILIKLLNRQTSYTVYEIVKDLRNGFNAFIFNTTAKAFNLSLKEQYDPLLVYEDYLIEDILQRAFQNNLLKKTNSKNKLPDLFTLKKHWNSK